MLVFDMADIAAHSAVALFSFVVVDLWKDRFNILDNFQTFHKILAVISSFGRL